MRPDRSAALLATIGAGAVVLENVVAIPRSIEFLAEWIADLIGHMTGNGLTCAATREDAARA